MTTPSYQRIRQRFESIATGDDASDVGHLVLAVLLEESLGSQCLKNLGLSLTRIREGCFGPTVARTTEQLQQQTAAFEQNEDPVSEAEPARQVFGMNSAPWLHAVHDRARAIARRSGVDEQPSSQHLVQAMVEADGPARIQLADLGVTQSAIERQLSAGDGNDAPLPVDFEIVSDLASENAVAAPIAAADDGCPPPAVGEAGFSVRTLIDASLNRSREGLRVLEDFARFIARDEMLCRTLKQMRHDLVAFERDLKQTVGPLVTYRDVEQDVGTGITRQSELNRDSVAAVVSANARRVQEALRSLEEFGKTLCQTFASRIKQLRYQTYAVEQQALRCCPESAYRRTSAVDVSRLKKLSAAHLYVLVTERLCRLSWKEAVQGALHGGADMIQLREKTLADAELVRRSQWIAAACRDVSALLIVNDRWDLVVASGADGVHLGQEDEAAAVTRTRLPEDQLIGVSTHNQHQIQAACGVEVDYLGVGPVFPSRTKNFDTFPGLDLVRVAAVTASVPWFAIGGIRLDNLGALCRAGASRIAVSAAVIGNDNPAAAAQELRQAVTQQQSSEDGQTLRFTGC
ncbi:MAG: thiamine phosphate synthase [Fuerstiella sp.]